MKILYTATVLSHICQFHLPYLEELQKRGHTVHVAARNNLGEKNGLQLRYTDRYFDIPFQRSPKNPQNLAAFRSLKALIARERYDLIVCNTPMGGILTRLAAVPVRRRGTRVVYIAHGFHFYRGAARKNWAVFYPIERAMAHLCDTLVTINEEDTALARKKFHTHVAHIHGIGVSPERYHPVSTEETRELRRAEGLTEDDFVILCTGELNANKDQATLIEAARLCRDKIPNLKVLLAGNGPLEGKLRQQVRDLHLEQAVRFLGYRTDLERVTPAVDVVVSCSRREGLPLNVLEAMLCKKPVLAAANRGNSELVASGESGVVFRPGDAAALADAMCQLANSGVQRAQWGQAGLDRAQTYTVEAVKEELLPVLLKKR